MNITVQINTRQSDANLARDRHYRLFSHLASWYPELSITFISDNNSSSCFFQDKHLPLQTAGPSITNGIMAGIWYRFSLLRLLNKNKASIFISDSAYCNLSHPSRQIITIASEAQIQKSAYRPFISKAFMIVVPNEHIRKLLIETYPDTEKKIFMMSSLPDENIVPLSFPQQEEVRSVISEGKNYFLLPAENIKLENVITCLKAFSFFKKWQQSGMKLLIIYGDNMKSSLMKQLETYKYRQDVQLLPPEKKDVACTAAYCCMFLSEKQPADSKTADCIQLRIPLIMHDNEYNRSAFGESVLYASTDEKELSQKMILMYKDESLKNELSSEAFNNINAVSFSGVCKNYMNAIISTSM